MPCLVAILLCLTYSGAVTPLFNFGPPAGSLGIATTLTVVDVYLVRFSNVHGGKFKR